MIESSDPEVPFRELFPYYEKDAHYFFGRDADSRILIANLLASRITVAFGASGAGKSSVLRAGVMAQVHKMADARTARGAYPEVAAAIVASWSGDPVGALRRAIAEGFARSGARARPDLGGGASLREVIDRCAEALDDENRGQLLIILDQFEEYFLYHPPGLVSGSFAAELAELVADPELPASVLLALREDAIGKLDAFKGGIPGLFGNLVRVEPLERGAAGEAIVRTVETFNQLHTARAIQVEPKLVDDVLDQVQIGSVRLGDAAGLTPALAPGVRRVESTYLQLVMTRVWREERRKGSDQLTARTLEDLGKAENIVREHVDARIAALTPKQQDGAAEVLGYLVTSGGAKISYTPTALAERTGLPEAEVAPILEALAAQDTRILRRDNAAYELFHDVLAGVVLDWRRRHRAEQQLAAAKRRAEDAEAREREQAAVTRRLRLLVVAIAVISLFGIALTIKILQDRQNLEHARRVNLSRELTANAEKVVEDDPQLALLLIKEAVRIENTDQVRQALSAYALTPARVVIPRARPAQGTGFSPEGKRFVTAGDDDVVRIWDSDSGRFLLQLSGHSGTVRSMAFSPDGARVLTASDDGTSRVWDARSGQMIAALAANTAGGDGAIHAWNARTGHMIAELPANAAGGITASFNPDGRQCITSNFTRTRLWDAATGKVVMELARPNDLRIEAALPEARLDTGTAKNPPAPRAMFSSDGSRVLVAGHTDDVYVWDVASGALLSHLGASVGVLSPDGLFVLTGDIQGDVAVWNVALGKRIYQRAVIFQSFATRAAAFSPDGRRFIVGSDDHTASIWLDTMDVARRVLRGHSGPVKGVVFSPDGQRAATASVDNFARVWDASSGQSVLELRGHFNSVNSAVFSPDGQRILTTSDDHTVRLWNAASGKRLAHGEAVRSSEWSRDGRLVLTASTDRKARIWDAASGALVATLEGHSGYLTGARFSVDAKRAITSSADHTARVWDVASGKQVAQLSGHSGPVWSATLSPDRTRALTAGDDHTVRLWDAASGALVAELTGHSDLVSSAEFSHDGQLAVTASFDRSVRVWDASSGKLLAELRDHTGAVRGAAFSADDKHILSFSDDHTARVWDVASGKQLLQLNHHSAAVVSAAFSPDDRSIVTASLDGVALIWDAATGKITAELRGHSGRLLHAVFSPDGKRVLTASTDGTARLWDAPTGIALAALRGHSDLVRTVAFSPDGKRAVTASGDGTAQIWDISEYTLERLLARDPGRDFTCEERVEYLHEVLTCPEPASH